MTYCYRRYGFELILKYKAFVASNRGSPKNPRCYEILNWTNEHLLSLQCFILTRQ